MQQARKGIPAIPRFRGLTAVAGVPVAAVAAVLLAAPGCAPPPQANTTAAKPFEGVALTVRCGDAAFAEAIKPMARVWAARSGAKVEVVAAGDAADVLVLPAAEVGHWADRGELLSVPPAIRDNAAHPYQWQGVLPAYRGEQLAGWGNQVVALPLAGDGHVLVFPTDFPTAYLYQALTDRALEPPATWEDYAAVAAGLTQVVGKPALPPAPADPARAADLFLRVAACYDRPAVGEGELGKGLGGRDPLSFQFDTGTGKPRLQTAGFRAAAGWLAGLKAAGAVPAGGPDDPAAALKEGRAQLAVLSLAELARLREGGRVPARFGVAPLPGSRQYADADGKLVPADANYVPYFAGGRFGVVRKTCPKPEAAFDLLADLGGPARSAELVSTPGLGAGPFRNAHLDLPLLWYGYGFDEPASKALVAAMQKFVRPEVKNPVFGLRGPDQARLTAALGGEATAVATGAAKPEDALKRADEAWEKIGAETPGVLQQRRRAVGLQ